MRKYKLLKPLPGYPVGYIFEQDSWGNISFITSVDTVVFPDFFEEIKEPSDEEVLGKWIYNTLEPYIENAATNPMSWSRLGDFKCKYMRLAKELIRKGFDVSKLREGK